MRKKSHISLANYILKCEDMKVLTAYKKSFYLGSILPDCTPSFLTRRHSIEETFDILKKEILKITENYDENKGVSSYYCRHLGVITHYIADYFTLPHNKIFTGNIKEHCSYEKHLKHALKSYVRSDASKKSRKESLLFQSVDELLKFIKEMHEEYVKAIKAIKVDCHYIVELCYRVVDAILQFIHRPTMIELSN